MPGISWASDLCTLRPITGLEGCFKSLKLNPSSAAAKEHQIYVRHELLSKSVLMLSVYILNRCTSRLGEEIELSELKAHSNE